MKTLSGEKIDMIRLDLISSKQVAVVRLQVLEVKQGMASGTFSQAPLFEARVLRKVSF